MKKSVLLMATLLLATVSHAQWWGKKVKGNGNMTTETRTTGDYDRISCAGSFDYILVAGEEGKIKIEGEENLLEYIVTEVKGDKLVIKTVKTIHIENNF